MPFSKHHLRSLSLNIRRREMIQVGYSGCLGAGLHTWFSQRAAASGLEPLHHPKAKSVLLVFLTGAASHHDTFDMKPDAPEEIRGTFDPIATPIPGIHVCEHLPKLASRAKQYSLIRTLSHRDNNHLMSTHHVLTGHLQPGGFFDKVASRDDWPCYASASAYLRPRNDGIPNGINLPTFLLQGPLTWPGQHAGFLGPQFDPWQIKGDPQNKDFRVDSLTLAQGMNVTRLEKRQLLLKEVNLQQQQLEDAAQSRRLSHDQQLVFSLLTSSKLTQAFDMNREPDAVRDRYGRHTTGQSLLLARRLVEVGVPIVQVNIGRVQTWDNHSNIFPTLKDRLLPPLDQGMSALLDDLSSQGLLAETLVLMLGEFGRTPKINTNNGRDHWGPCFFGLFAGAGVQGGQVIGKSDPIGAYPVSTAYAPDDVGATVYHALGIDPQTVVRDRLNRPTILNQGHPIEALYDGSSS